MASLVTQMVKNLHWPGVDSWLKTQGTDLSGEISKI